MAEKILCPESPAVFKMHEAMCEPATHRNWAAQQRVLAQSFGVEARGI
jgi:hypothetical protein